MRIERVPISQLEALAAEADARTPPDGVLPITPQRARAHCRNPFAAPDDVALVVAYAEDACVGYLGMVPGRVRIGDRTEKVHWLSTWYVPPALRSTGVGLRLAWAAFDLKYDIMVTGVSEQARRVYEGLRFEALRPLTYRDYRFARNWTNALLRRAKVKSAFINGISRSVDRCISQVATRCCFWRLSGPMRKRLEDFELREVDRVNPPPDYVCIRGNPPCAFVRNPSVINWMLEYPWVLESPAREDPRYAFSSARPLFRYVALEILRRSTAGYAGYVVLQVFRTPDLVAPTIRVLDWSLARASDLSVLAAAIFEQAWAFGAGKVDLPPQIAAWFPQPPRLFGKPVDRSRIYFARPPDKASRLWDVIDKVSLDYCDGDSAFA